MIILNVIQALAALYVLSKGLSVLNRMSARTAPTQRLTYIALSTGALAAAASSMGAGSAFECVFVIGMALYLAADRRKRKHKGRSDATV